MQIVRVRRQLEEHWGVVEGDHVFRLPGGSIPATFSEGDSLGPIADLQLLAPAVPSKIVCVGRNYVAHAAEHGADVPTEPLLFLKPPSAVLAPGSGIVLPELSQRVEHEGDLALVIGERCHRVEEGEAWSKVLGITCANDVTARDLQRSDKQWTRGKGFDTFCPVGPWVITGLGEDEVADLGVSCRVNGELRQEGRTRHMVFPPAFIISYITQVMTLEPGDLILTGTPAGVGPLSAGDTVEVEVEGVGVLKNTVVFSNQE